MGLAKASLDSWSSLNGIATTELCWLAGLLEGEGSFMNCTSRYKGRRYVYARVSIQMCDLDVMERVQKIFGTKIYVLPPSDRKIRFITTNKQMYRLWADGHKAQCLMKHLRPYMGLRRQGQIDAALGKASTPPTAEERLAQRLSAIGKAQETRRRLFAERGLD